ncbi:MAG: glucosyltransferase domain-containing protein [Verrucomicrobia bacterium]|nr:glucosyltransferase domain-containing protein [Verrucomicrobiota bacterium]
MFKSNHSKYRIPPVFWASLVLLAAVLFPILQADRFISDDWRRAVSGQTGWTDDGRPLTELTMRIADLGSPVLDISPVPQLGALVCFAAITVVLARKFRIRSPVAAALIFLPLAANPLTLRNIAHKFDSLPIALSILCAVLPIALSRSNGWMGRVWECLLLVASLCLYQASVNFYLVFAVLELVLLQRESVEPQLLFRTCIIRLVQFIAALLIYRLIASLTVRGDYAVQASQLAIAPHDLPLAIDKVLSVWSFIWHKFPALFRVVFGGILALGALVMLSIELRYFWRLRGNQRPLTLIGVAVLLLLIPAAWLLGATGPLIFLREFAPSLTRVDGGFGALLASALILLIWPIISSGIRERWQIAFLCIPGLLLTSFAAIYANTQKQQRIYEEQIGARLSADIRRIAIEEPIKSVSFRGDVGFAPLVSRAEQRFPIIKYLVDIDLREGLTFSSSVLRYYQIPGLEASNQPDPLSNTVAPCDSPPSLIDPNYTITRCGDHLVVMLTAG